MERGLLAHGDHCDAIVREGHALTDAAQTAGIDARVPSCPEWTIGDLLGHVGRIHHYVTSIVERRPGAPDVHWTQAEPPPLEERIEWFASGVDPLADGLRTADPEMEAWTWTDDHTVGFWARRMANETLVHRWDAQRAAGDPNELDRTQSVDGIDEFLALIPFWRGVAALADLQGSIHLHCTDGDGEWLLRFGDGVVVTREHAKGDVAVRGTASNLMLVINGRLAPTTTELFGDSALFDRFLERVHW